MRISDTLAVDIRADFVARMRSIGKNSDDIAQLDRFLLVSLRNVNDLSLVPVSRVNEQD